MSPFKFELIHTSSKSRARVGRIHTPHGVIDTPNFIAVGTNATLKALDSRTVDALGLQLMFCNTYHLMLQPGTEVVSKAGGLHQFMNRTHPLITDSGGFQVFSLAYGSVASELKSQGKRKGDGLVLKIGEEGVWFRSYRDGSKFLLTPETSILAQKQLGADIIIPFDELPPYHIDRATLKKSLDRTHRWEKRSLDQHLKDPKEQAIYAVVHGGIDKELRRESVDYLSTLPFDGFAIGGSVGKNKEEMLEMLEWTMVRLPEEKPNHLLGIGDVDSIEQSLPFGVDTFDSSYPTRAARHGVLLFPQGKVKITRTVFANDYSPLDETGECTPLKGYTKAYLHHLFKAKEVTSLILATIVNVYFMVNAMRSYRKRILLNEI